MDRSFKEAPFFYWLYSLLIAGGALAVVLIPNAKLIRMVILSQVLNGVLLPLVIIFMLLLINRKDLMGEYVNSRSFNAIAWTTAIVVIALVAVYALCRRRVALASGVKTRPLSNLIVVWKWSGAPAWIIISGFPAGTLSTVEAV